MDINQKVQVAIDTLTAQRNQALNTVVEYQVRARELEGDLAEANNKIVALEGALADATGKSEKKAKTIKHRS